MVLRLPLRVILYISICLVISLIYLSHPFASGPRFLPTQYPSLTNFDTKAEIDNRPLKLPRLSNRYAPYFPDLALPPIFDTPTLRPLAKRLHEFLERPGFDITAAQDLNDANCPVDLANQLVNPDQYNGDIEFWTGVDTDEMVKRRAGVVKWLEKRVRNGEDVVAIGNSGQGRGIVMTGGNGDTTIRLLAVMRHLRRLDVDLPIEVFHYPGELTDHGQRRDIENLGGTIREIRGVEKEEGAWKNWQIKGLAIVQSTFREVLYLDSDNTPLRNPSHLFDAPIYLESGRAVFWPDLSKDHPANAIWRIVGKPCSLRSWTFESGQFVIDKAGNRGMNLAALLIASEMQNERDFWFHMCGGDKDTFRWGFEMLGLDYGESPRWMSALGLLNPWEGGRFCGHTVLQYDLVKAEGQDRELPLFAHSNLLKHLGAEGLSEGKVFTHVKRVSDDSAHLATLNHARAFVYLGVLRGMCIDFDWHGTVKKLSDQERARVTIDTIEIGDIEGNVFDGFEKVFFEEGGRVGGW